MPRARSAGIVLFRRQPRLEVLLGHMGGPFWATKDAGAWTIPKGLIDAGTDADELTAATREFREETGHEIPSGVPRDLGDFDQSRHKTIRIWAIEGDLDPDTCVSNTFELEWPPKSGRLQEFPEIDRAAWFDLATADDKVVAGQRAVLEALRAMTATG